VEGVVDVVSERSVIVVAVLEAERQQNHGTGRPST